MGIVSGGDALFITVMAKCPGGILTSLSIERRLENMGGGMLPAFAHFSLSSDQSAASYFFGHLPFCHDTSESEFIVLQVPTFLILGSYINNSNNIISGSYVVMFTRLTKPTRISPIFSSKKLQGPLSAWEPNMHWATRIAFESCMK